MGSKKSVFAAVQAFRSRLDAGATLAGAAITFSDPLVSDALAPASDFLWIDTEHGGLCPDSLHGHLLAARAAQIPALVRLTSGSVHEIKPILDGGADGIIVPQVTSAAEVRSVVEHCRYRPDGIRGFGPRVPTRYGRDGTLEHLAEANRSVFVAIQIENLEAFEDLDRILGVPGLDSVVIGPSDLALAMGLGMELRHPLLLERIEEIARRARGAGLYVGAGMGPDPDYARVLVERGVQWVQVGGDFSYMVSVADSVLARCRGPVGSNVSPTARRTGASEFSLNGV